MDRPLLLSLASCTQLSLVGGKAAGLARLLAGGFPVPPGICVTTEAYHRMFHMAGCSSVEQWQAALQTTGAERQAILSRCRTIIQQTDITELTGQIIAQLQSFKVPLRSLWAVRSSATNEDGASASFAGVYCTKLGIPLEAVGEAAKELWMSVWDERVLNYHVAARLTDSVPAMAVVIQPLLAARTAGVAYSTHPISGLESQAMINAVAGLAENLVDGSATPDQYVVEMSRSGQPVRIVDRMLSGQAQALREIDRSLHVVPLPEDEVGRATLSDNELFELAGSAKQIEKAFGYPVDLEWLFDGQGLWLLQARPISGLTRSLSLTDEDCEWSRANFKETLPELPSPLGLSFLELFMERYILSRYRLLGCRIPEGISSVRIFQGRPYINMTLFHILVAQLRGDPFLLAEQMGGEALVRVPKTRPLGCLPFIRAGIVMMAEMRKAVRKGPAWFAEMKAMASASEHRTDRLRTVSGDEIVRRLDRIEQWLDDHELTFGIAGGVSQCLQVLGRMLPRWLGEDWRPLMNGALQGQSAVISAQQIVRLAELTEIVRRDLSVLAWFRAEEWNPAEFNRRLAGTDFLPAFTRYLEDYGHRGVGESDVMSPRFADQPELLLSVLRTQLQASGSATPAEIIRRQTAIRERALAELRVRFGWRWHQRAIFFWWYRRLCRFFALREANRHHLMYYSTAVRNLVLRLGEV
ncbi:MAG: hypothetical protein OEV08_12240, partial [Nitrospira sp.]|nr:hypothetical protein [Nitrospira sp.]